MGVYKTSYTGVYSQVYARQEGPVIPIPSPSKPQYIITTAGYVQTSFMDFEVDADSDVRAYSNDYGISSIKSVSGLMRGKNVPEDVPISHYTMNGEAADFEGNQKDWFVFWSVAVATVSEVLNTYGIETRIKQVETGLQIRAGRMKYVAGNHPDTNFDDADVGTIARLAKADTQNVIGLKKITLTLELSGQ